MSAPPSAPIRHLIAMGGGGFSMEPNNPRLDQCVLAQAGKVCPKVCLVPTVSGDSVDDLCRFYAAFAKHACHASHPPLFR